MSLQGCVLLSVLIAIESGRARQAAQLIQRMLLMLQQGTVSPVSHLNDVEPSVAKEDDDVSRERQRVEATPVEQVRERYHSSKLSDH